MEVKTVGVACDHAGFPLKQFVIQYLESKGYQYKDFGTYSDTSCDYPDFAHPLAEAVESGECYPGIAICGSGEGMVMTLNKHSSKINSGSQSADKLKKKDKVVGLPSWQTHNFF